MAQGSDAVSRIRRDQYGDKAAEKPQEYSGFTTRPLDEQVRDLREVVLGMLPSEKEQEEEVK